MPTPTERLSTALAGRYRLERELGAGGMATVYLAHDLKHDRKVALKVLRPELAAIIGAERFLAEIKTTANLQHPHILALFDSGEARGFVYYVMPYIEGESLRERITREHQLPVEEAIRIAKEVADALQYAHSHGVVHRDIKPENVMLHDGHALVADFGIALAVSRSEGGTRMTETGMSLGTPHYMSPEQAMGEREITPRADVYALGCVLYEMLTGEPPFTGTTAQAIIARVMTEAPRRLTMQRHTIPPHVEAAVFTALEKLPADRFASAKELSDALENPSYRGSTAIEIPAAEPTGAAGAPGRWLRRAALPLAGIAGIALGAVAMRAFRPRPPAPVTRYGLALPPGQEADPSEPAVPSPDGARIVYVGPGPSRGGQLWVKARDRYVAAPLTGTDGVTDFTFSPDGQWLAFAHGGRLQKIPIVGGAAITLADTVSGNPGLAWLDDGTLVFMKQGGGELRRVPESGGIAEVLVADSGRYEFPSPLPGGRGILYTRCQAACSLDAEIWAYDLRTRVAKRVVGGAVMAQYVPIGAIVYVRPDGAMLAARFDLGSLQTEGPPIPVMDSVTVVNRVLPLAAISQSGTLMLRYGPALSILQRFHMVWVDRAGRETPVDTSWTLRFVEFGANAGWALSPDGTRLAIGLATDAGDDIWVKRLPRGTLSRVSYDDAAEFRPRWMPDGRTLMFESNRPGTGAGGIYVRAADGTGSDSLVLRAPGGVYEAAWSPDKQWLVYRTGGTVAQTGGRDIVGIRPGSDTAPQPVVVTPYDEEAIAISPDGRWLAYESNETGRTEIFVRPFPATASAKRQISNGGGVAPVWAKHGRELFYVTAQRDMMAVAVSPAPGASFGEPHRLFHLQDDWYLTDQEFYTPYDVAPDGRFIMAKGITPPSTVTAPLIVVDNWFTELRQKLGSQ
jgi:eukaryotic-like serine/threonine-protein kinase